MINNMYPENKMQPKDIIEQLKLQASLYGKEVVRVCNFLLEDPKFLVWSGSSKEHQHHYGEGGLLKHTYEVVDLCGVAIGASEIGDSYYHIDRAELFMAALFHDCGKLYDYMPSVPGSYTFWCGTEHKRLIHHISRSGLMWSEAVKKSDKVYSEYHDRVLHAILAHHGTREYGSPVAPKSRVAWLVHHCDCISARMFDADTWDCVKGATI